MKIIRILKLDIVDKQWVCIKIPLIYIWLKVVKDCLLTGYSVPIPLGICKFFDCTLFLEGWGLALITFTALLLSIAYVADFKMKWVTLCLFILSVIVFTSEESSGILKRNGTFSYLFLAQSFAYWFNKSNVLKLSHSRIQYSVQAVTVGYFLAACSKLLDSGIGWASDGSRITLQVLKSIHYAYYTNLENVELVKGEEVLRFLNESQNVIHVVLAASLILELFALTAAVNRRAGRWYGLALLMLHIGIYYIMDVFIYSFAVPMVIVLINPLYLTVLLFDKILNNKRLSIKLKST